MQRTQRVCTKSLTELGGADLDREDLGRATKAGQRVSNLYF